MFLLKSSHSKHRAYQVIGFVLLVPLMISLMGLGRTGAVLAIATCAYGIWFAARYANKGLTAIAVIITLLNVASLVMLSTPSILMALGYIAGFYAYPPFSEWLYWRG